MVRRAVATQVLSWLLLAGASAQVPDPGAPGAAPAPLPAAAAPASPPPAAPPPPKPLPFEAALLAAANDLFSKATLPAGGADRVTLVIDPLIDGVTAAQSAATQAMERRIIELVRAQYPRFAVRRFTTAEVAKSPVVLIGTFTPINQAGQAGGPRDVFRICLALADLGSRKIISKGVARALPEGVDATPTPYFADAPAFAADPGAASYIKSCQGTRPGDPIDPVYADRILSAALLNDGIEAYERRRYRDALDLYTSASRTPGGDQLRTYNGLYLANWRLNRRDAAAAAFGRLVDYGLKANQLGVKLLFKTGSVQFAPEGRPASPYALWLRQIGARAAASESCLEVVGHTSPTGPAALNERLSILRAEYVKDRVAELTPALAGRMIASGVGSRQNLVGTGRDDGSDVLDRRVEFKVIRDCRQGAPR